MRFTPGGNDGTVVIPLHGRRHIPGMEVVEELAKNLLLVLGAGAGGTLCTIAAIRISEAFWRLVFRGAGAGGRSAGSPSSQPVHPPCRGDRGDAWRTPRSKPALKARRRESSQS